MARTINLGFRLLPWQVEVLRILAWRLVLVCARQVGKTRLICYILARFAFGRSNATYWYVSPTTELCEEKFDEFKAIFGTEPGWRWNKTRYAITLPNGTRIQFRSFEQGLKIKGRTLHGVVMDECGEMAGWFWRTVVGPMLTTTGGWAIFIGTPPNPLMSPDPQFFEKLAKKACGGRNPNEIDGAVKGEDGWAFARFDYMARGEHDDVYRFDTEQKMDDMPDEERDREYFAKFTTGGEGQLDVGQLRYWGKGHELADVPGNIRGIMTVDPSFEEHDAADPRAISIRGFDHRNWYWLCDMDQGRWGYDTFLERIFSMWKRGKARGWLGSGSYVLIEKNGSGPFRKALERECRLRGLQIPFVDLRSYRSKYNRLLSLQPLLRRRHLIVPANHKLLPVLEEQMSQFPRGLLTKSRTKLSSGDLHHYDLLDTVAFGAADHQPARAVAPVRQGEPRDEYRFDKMLKALKKGPRPKRGVIRV